MSTAEATKAPDLIDVNALRADRYVGGRWQPAASGKRFDVIDPSTERVITSVADARGEVSYAAEFFRWFAEEAVRINGELSVAPSAANRILVQYQPVGVSVLITPWNFPAAMATRKIAPALAAGCSCVLKPAEETPLTAYALADLLQEAGVPAGVVNVITTGTAGPVVAAMLHDPRVVSFRSPGQLADGEPRAWRRPDSHDAVWTSH
jgi:acyl-CoA reductase-like NAD-dependent aldehyde dehydrogenase